MAEQSDDNTGRRAVDPYLVDLVEKVGELRGTQSRILETLEQQWRRQLAEDRDHAAIKAELVELRGAMADVPRERHHEHHDFVDTLIDERRARAELCRQARDVMLERALPIALLAMLGVGLYLVGAKEWGAAILHKVKP